MRQRIFTYRKAPVTQAKRSSLFRCQKVLLGWGGGGTSPPFQCIPALQD